VNATSTNARIARIDSRLRVLTPWIEELEAARREALSRLPDPGDTSLSASKIRSELSQIENGLRGADQVFVTDSDVCSGLTDQHLPGLKAAREEVQLLCDQRDTLEAELPTRDEVAGAERKAKELAGTVAEQGERFGEAWSAFMDALTAAEEAAREVARARSEAQDPIRKLTMLHEEYALDITVPKALRASTPESKLAGHLATLLRDVGYRQVINQDIDRELAKVREQAARAFA